MQLFVVLSAVVACALSQVAYPYAYSPFGYSSFSAHPYQAHPYHAHPYHAHSYHAHPYHAHPYAAYPYNAIHAPVVVPTSSQYHAQDELGQFTFGTAGDNQARVETKSLDGTVTGAYSYVDPTGKQINVNYLADHNGFRVLGANNLPEAPAAPVVAAVSGPEPVQDTPEVVAARADFEMKFAEAKAAAEAAPENLSRKRRQAVFYSALAHPTPFLAKSTLKYQTFEPVDAAVPADTKKIELKEKETEITHAIAPLAYSAAVPALYNYNYHYGVPALRSPYFYHL